jgi:hypothetical protein
MSSHLSRHVDNDDMRHYRFARNSGIPHGYFEDTARDVFLRWRWLAIVALILALIGATLTASDMPNF